MRKHTVAEVMTRDVVSVPESAGYKEIVEALAGRGVSAVPVSTPTDGCSACLGGRPAVQGRVRRPAAAHRPAVGTQAGPYRPGQGGRRRRDRPDDAPAVVIGPRERSPRRPS